MASSRLNVLQIRSSRGAGGGPEKTILFTAKTIDLRRFSMPVVYLKSDDDPDFDLDRRAAKMGVDDFQTIGERFKLDLGALRRLLALLRERQIHVIHSHCYKSDLYALLLSRFHEVKLVTTAHGPFATGPVIWSAGNWRVRYLYDRLDLRLLKRFDRVLMVTETMRPLLDRYRVPEEKQVVVRNAIDTSFFRQRSPDAELRRQLRIPETGRLLGAVGRLNPEKDYPTLLAAFEILLQKGAEVHLAIAGGGPEEEHLSNRLRESGLEDRVSLVGHVRDVRGFYDLLDAYVLSSTREGLPNTVLEAMAMGVPIVATAVDGVEEAARHDHEALLVAPQDPAALASAIGNLLADPALRRRLTAAARTRVEKHFSFAGRVKKLEAIYREVSHA